MAIVAGTDQGQNVVSGSFTATGQSASRRCEKPFNISITGTFVATIVPQRSFDGGTTWGTISTDALGTAASWTAPVEVNCDVPGEIGVLFRLNCTAYTSGTATYRMSV